MLNLTKFWRLLTLKKEERKKYPLFYKLAKRFFYTYLVIAGIIIGVSFGFNILVIKDGDFQNWTSFVWELGLSAYLAIAILTYENFQKDIENLVRDIKKIEENQQKAVEEQEAFRRKHREVAMHLIGKNLIAQTSILVSLQRMDKTKKNGYCCWN